MIMMMMMKIIMIIKLRRPIGSFYHASSALQNEDLHNLVVASSEESGG